MYINRLDAKNRHATVTLNYDELCCINNTMYQVSRFDDIEKDNNFNNVRAKIIKLFALVKHGGIPEFELQNMYKLMINPNYTNEEEGVE